MAKPVKKISDKLSKVSDSYNINMYDNGFMLDIGGRNTDDEWASAKIMCSTVEELAELVKEAAEMERE